MNDHEPPNDPQLDAPQKLVEELQASQKQRLFVSPQLDRMLLAAAHRQLQSTIPSRSRWTTPAAWTALAASLALVGTLIYSANRPARQFALSGDINGDGRVDVLDALVLAREIEHGALMKAEWDLNGDGIVDYRDAEAIVQKAVELDEGRSS